MTQWIDWASIGSFLSHVAVGLGLLFIGVIVFELTTKFNDRELIKKGNVAVALKLWGKGIGLAIVIFTVWSNSVNRKFGRCNSLGSSRYHYSSSDILGY